MSMNPFEFRTVASIAVQWGGARALGESLAARFSARSALLITDKGLVSAGLIAPVLASLEGSGFRVTVFDLSLIHISEPTRLSLVSRMPSSA